MFRLMDKKWPETGKPIIKTRVFGTICAPCRRRGIKNCPHGNEDPWSNQQQNRKIELLMSDKKSTWQREMRNEDVEDDSEPAFIYESVMALAETKRDYGGSEKHSHIFTAIDPAAGGNQSKYAIISIVVVAVYDAKSQSKRTKLVVLTPHLFLGFFLT